MIKKYDDNYILVRNIVAVERMLECCGRYMFDVHIGGTTIHFRDTDIARITALRNQIIKEWMEAVNANPR